MKLATKSDTKLHAFVARGAKAGTILSPHLHADGHYVVSMTRFEKDYVRIDDAEKLLSWLERGYRLRMSNKAGGVPTPSLIEPRAIFRPVAF